MKRKLIVTSAFFLIGLLTTAFVTLSLLMSLIHKPAALSIARIAGAVGRGLEMLEKNGQLTTEKEIRLMPVSTMSLSAMIISKAKQKGIQIKEPFAISRESWENKPVFSGSQTQSRKPDAIGLPRKNKPNAFSRRPTKEETLVYGLLSLHYGDASEEAKFDLATKVLALQHPDGGWSAWQDMPSDPYATGLALYSLQESGMLSAEAADSQKAIAFLLRSQHADGSWLLNSLMNTTGEANVEKPDIAFRQTESTHWASLALLESLPDKK